MTKIRGRSRLTGLLIVIAMSASACGGNAADSSAAGGAATSSAPATSATDETSSPASTSAASGSESEAPEGSWSYVAFGDSWPYGAHCNGCSPFPGLYAELLEAKTGHPVQFVNLTENGGTSGDLLTSIQQSQPTRDAIAAADIIVISTGANDLEPAFAQWLSSQCGGRDELACFREVAHGWRENFDGMLAEIEKLRAGKPTAVRVVTNSNEFLADPGLIAAFGKDFATSGGAAITAMHHHALCLAARKHGATCVDLRPVLNGPDFTTPQDVNTQDAMQRVAQALVDSGVAELH